MYREREDFITDWQRSSEGTSAVLRAVTDETLGQSIVEDHNSLGWLGWHLTTAMSYFSRQLGIQLPALPSMEQPKHASEIADCYEQYAAHILELAGQQFDTAYLREEIDMHGALTTRGQVLRMMVDHQTHHRGQMTVLLRQAGLPVPGVMGPTKEESVARK